MVTPPEPLSRRSFLVSSVAAAGLAAVGCSTGGSNSDAGSEAAGTSSTTAPPAYLTGAAPVGAVLPPGSRPDPSRPEGTDLLPKVDHIVVLMMENHSFDNYLGMLGRGDGFALDDQGQPTNANPDENGNEVRAHHLTTTSQVGNHVSQNWKSSHIQYDDGKMDGFVRSTGEATMGYWTGDDLPFYYGLARTFPLCDRYFASVLAQTYPNRRFLHAGTALGLLTTTLPKPDDPSPPNGTIFDKLNTFGIPWRNYYAAVPEIALYPAVFFANQDKTAKMDQFFTDAAAGTLPGFSLLSIHPNLSEENPQDITYGESFAANVINAVMQGPGWGRTMLIFNYDEHGGYYDHVPPPAAIPPDDVPPNVAPGDPPGAYDRYGFRVPAVIVSPYARSDYVSHVVHDHTSVLRLVETKWNLGALTYRDANASNLLDSIDFDSPPAFATPPTLPAPRTPRPPNESYIPPAGAPADES